MIINHQIQIIILKTFSLDFELAFDLSVSTDQYEVNGSLYGGQQEFNGKPTREFTQGKNFLCLNTIPVHNTCAT